jgi:hypothetical protein
MEDNIKIKKQNVREETGFIWLRIESDDGTL